jgi:serine/threonine-protein kinase
MMSAGALEASERDPLVGQVLGSYRMVRVLGEGGMGRVYEALDLRDDRRAALKVLRSAYAAEPAMAGRFLNEARALQKTGHPGVVAIYEAGVELGPTGSTPFIAMEFLEGTSLRDWVASQAGPCKDALLIAKELATVLLAVHERSIIHRDFSVSDYD